MESKEISKNIRLGFFVLISTSIFFYGLYSIGKKQSLFGSTISVHTLFQDVKGLKAGNNVRYAGLKVGVVKQIEIVNDSTLKVILAIDKEYQNNIKHNALASIGSDGLVGNMVININPGSPSGRMIKENDFLKTYSGKEANEIIGALGNTTEVLEKISINFLEVSDKINNGSGTLSMLLNDSKIPTQFQTLLIKLNETSQNFVDISKTIEDELLGYKQSSNNLSYLMRDSSLKPQIDQVMSGTNNLINGEAKIFIENLTQSSKTLDSSIIRLNNLLKEIETGNNVINSLTISEKTNEEFNNILQNANKSAIKFNENMDALKHNFLFRRYFKKQEKNLQKKKN